jgi:hypothetical protein
MLMWNPASIAAFVGAITALLTAIAGVITAWRAHSVVNTQVKPQVEANTTAIEEIKNGGNTNEP